MADESTSTTRQGFLSLNVGGTSFHLLPDTVRKYPDSLLAKLLTDFPDFAGATTPFYIDRNPEFFPWIIEIYRDGNFRRCVPSLTREDLAKELSFYSLPSLSELGIPQKQDKIEGVRDATDRIVQTVYDGLVEFDLLSSLPVYVWIYHEFDGRKIVGPMHVAFRYQYSNESNCGVSTRHDDFFQNICFQEPESAGKGGWVFVRHRWTGQLYAIRDLCDHGMVTSFNAVAYDYLLEAYTGGSYNPSQRNLCAKLTYHRRHHHYQRSEED